MTSIQFSTRSGRTRVSLAQFRGMNKDGYRRKTAIQSTARVRSDKVIIGKASVGRSDQKRREEPFRLTIRWG